jgi:transketolase
MAKAIRQVYGEALTELGETHPELVVLDADVSSSTQTQLFARKFPTRFFNMGIAEANMVATAAGLAQQGFVPFANTFAVFISSIGLIATRALICYGEMNVKLAGAYSGLSDAYDGASHHSTEDIAILRAMPGMKVFCPSDAVSTTDLTRLALDTPGPCYIRLSRGAFPDLYPAGTPFQLGKGNVVREGKDVTVIACGILVHQALRAAETLARKGISVRVVDMYSIKPIDTGLICRSARETGAIVTAEEHSVCGGLGSAVAEALVTSGAPVPVEMVGVQDRFTESGPYPELLIKYGLDDRAVERAVVRVLEKKRGGFTDASCQVDQSISFRDV